MEPLTARPAHSLLLEPCGVLPGEVKIFLGAQCGDLARCGGVWARAEFGTRAAPRINGGRGLGSGPFRASAPGGRPRGPTVSQPGLVGIAYDDEPRPVEGMCVLPVARYLQLRALQGSCGGEY